MSSDEEWYGDGRRRFLIWSRLRVKGALCTCFDRGAPSQDFYSFDLPPCK
jgi:hypothetical protein